jgi:hypothetical protein
LVVEAALFDSNGDPSNLAEVTFTYADESGVSHRYGLRQVSAGAYRLEIPRPAEGAYRALLSYTKDGVTQETAAPFAVNAPEEWLPIQPGSGETRLAAWAHAGGGQVIGSESLAAAPLAVADRASEQDEVDWRRFLLLGLLLLWPLEIFIRRRWLPWMAA